jgi:hypothetical protein
MYVPLKLIFSNLLDKIQQLIEDGLGVQKFALKDKKLNIGGTKEDLGI